MYVCLCTGWGGSGLGAKHQGIEEPIKSGDVRGKIDKYKVRMNTDNGKLVNNFLKVGLLCWPSTVQLLQD